MENGLRIVVIDDDPVMRELLDALLGLSGHHVECFGSSNTGLERIDATGARPIDVILTDLHMPGLQGRELVSTLLAHRQPDTLVVGMSGSFPTERETELLEVFLQKPFSTDEFEQAVDRARHRRADHPLPTPGPGPEPLHNVLDDAIFTRLEAALLPAQLRSLYELALNDIAGREGRMRQASETGDDATLRSEAHAIKGGAGMVGALELQRLAARLEEGESNVVPEDFARARSRLERMLNERLPLVP